MPANHAETKVSFSLPILPISRSNDIKAQPLVETVCLDCSGLVPMWAILSGVFDIFRTSTSLSNLLLSVGMDSIYVCPGIVLARLRHYITFQGLRSSLSRPPISPRLDGPNRPFTPSSSPNSVTAPFPSNTDYLSEPLSCHSRALTLHLRTDNHTSQHP